MVDYDRLEEWLSIHLPANGSLDAIVIFTDTRPLDQIGAWRHTERLWQHRFSRMGPFRERWQGLFVPLTADTGLADVHCTWGGVFVAEAIAALRPAWHILLSDTDVAPTALFEIQELVQLCAQICHSSLQAGHPGLIVGTEPRQDINAGLAIFPGTAATPQPGCLRRKVMVARLHLLQRTRTPLPSKPAEEPPNAALNTPQQQALATALLHAEHIQLAALSRTPLAGILAQNSHDYLAAWALLGTWTCTLVWPTPDTARWPKACLAVNEQLQGRKPYLGAWARSSFEQGALCALAAMSSRQARYVAIPGDACFQCHGVGPCLDSPPLAVLPLVIHYYGNKDAIHELDRITAMPYLPQSLFGHGELPPYWCLYEWKAAADFAVACQHRAGISWPTQLWTDTGPLSLGESAASPHAVLPLAANIRDGLPPVPQDEPPVRLPGGDQAASEHPTRPPAGGPSHEAAQWRSSGTGLLHRAQWRSPA